MTLTDPAAWLAQVLWAGSAADIPGQVEAAVAAGPLSDPAALDSAAAVLAEVPPGTGDVVGRLRRLALALLAAGEFRLQERAWRAALVAGLDPLNGWQRVLDAASAAGNWQGVLEAGAWLLVQPQPRPHWISGTQAAVLRLLEDDQVPRRQAVKQIIDQTGLRFIPDLAQKFGGEDLARLVAAELALPPPQAVLAAATLAARDMVGPARLIMGALAAKDPGGVAPAVASAVCDLAEGRFDAANVDLDRLPDPATAEVADELVALWAFAAAGTSHPALAALAHRLAGLPGVLSHLSALITALGDQADPLPPLMTALTSAGVDPLDLLDMRLAQPGTLEDLQARQAVALVEADGSGRRGDRVLALARRLVESDQTSKALAAEFCRRHSALLAGSATGATLLARAFAAVRDWEGALAGLDAVLANQPQAHWAAGRAYFCAAQADRADLAVRYLKRVDLHDRTVQPALLSFAHGACLLADYATMQQCLDLFDALPPDSPVRQQDRSNLAGRLRAVLTGSAESLFGDHPVQPVEPDGAPRPRVLLIDPGFAVTSGHHFSYTLFGTSFFAEELSIDPAEVWVCARMTDDADEGEHARIDGSLHRLFGFNPYVFEEFPKTPRAVANIARVWEADLDRAFAGKDLDAVEVIYCHSMKASMAEGLANWIASRFGGRRLAVIIGVIEVDYMGEGPETASTCNAAYLAAIRTLRSNPGLHLVLYAETAYAVRELTAVLGNEVTVHNIPYLAASLAGPASDAKPAFSGKTVTIGLVGGSRRERGLDLFPELILALAGNPEVRWCVQLTRSLAEQVDPVFPAYLRWAVDKGICTWLDGRLDTDEYYAALRQMDIVLMPYRDRYAVSGSGVFYEAIALERYVIVPQDTFMAEVLADWRYPSEIMTAPSVNAALRALQRVLGRRETLAAEMQDLREAGRDRLPVGLFRRLVGEALASVRR